MNSPTAADLDAATQRCLTITSRGNHNLHDAARLFGDGHRYRFFLASYAAMRVLDEIARIKRTDAVVSEAFNWRISGRLAERWGWERHKPSRWRRHFIKRFYGSYPAPLDSNPAPLESSRLSGA